MHRYTRFALSLSPAPEEDLAALGRHWMGWDLERREETHLLKLDLLPYPLSRLTGRVRRYGFQALLTPPFRLAQGYGPLDLHHTTQAIAGHMTPFDVAGLDLSTRDGALVLTHGKANPDIFRLSTIVSRVLSPFRAIGKSAPTEGNLPARDDQAPPAHLVFRMSDRLPADELAEMLMMLRPILQPNLPDPFKVGSLSLVGEDETGWFRTIQRYPFASAKGARALPTRATMTPAVW